MNWLGASARSILAATLGAFLGAIAQLEARKRGFDFPPIVGLFAGLMAALTSQERSALRGALVASLAVWVAALTEVLAAPARGVVIDLVSFHERLGLARALGYVTCAVVAALLGSRARSRAPEEAPGKTVADHPPS